MSASGSTADKFPAGLRVLVVDDDRTCLMVLETSLRKCNYQVTKCDRGEAALSILRENKDGFDVVISDVHMPDMDGFKLLVQIGLEMNLPVIMMSVDDSKSVVMKGVIHGACDYLIKPVRIEQLRNIWQHVVRKRKKEGKDIEPSANLDDSDRMQKQQHDDPESSSANQGHNFKNIKRRKDKEDESEEKDDSSYVKKPRVTWTEELHQQFLAAVIHLGIDKAVPKKILELMNVPGITRENVASHLQKFRIYLKKLKDEQSGGMNTSFSEPDLHSLAAIGQVNQLPAQNLATLQTAAFNRSGNSVYPVLPPVDQTNTSFTFDTAKLRYGNQQGNYCNISKQMSFLHGIPTTTNLQNSLTNIHNPQAPNPMSGQSLSQTHNHALQKPVLPILAASQAAPHKTMSTRNGFSHLGIPPIMSTSTFQQDRNVKATNSTQGFVSSYGHLKTVNQNRTHDSTFDPSQHRNYTQGRLNVPHHNYALGKKMMGSQVTFSPGESSGSNIADIPSKTIVEHQQSYPLENSQGDLLTAILTQQKLQEDVGDAENEYAHNSDSLDRNEG